VASTRTAHSTGSTASVNSQPGISTRDPLGVLRLLDRKQVDAQNVIEIDHGSLRQRQRHDLLLAGRVASVGPSE
jgi:hypothetical protein